MKIKLLYLLCLCIIFISCENPLEDRVDELENELANQKLEQESHSELINSLIEQLTKQQVIIDSLNNNQKEYSDSLNLELYNLIEVQNQTINLLIDSKPSSGADFVRFDSLQICWGSIVANSGGKIGYFPVTFIEPPNVIITQIRNQGMPGITNITNTSAIFYSYSTDNKNTVQYVATGKWK